MPAPSSSQFALRFISGKYQGGEFPLRQDRQIVIGRSNDLDLVLVEDMVSRKHAIIETTDGQIAIRDLGSTNGTFVNGEKVEQVPLKEGDRILIGTSIIKLVTIDAASAMSEAEVRARMEATGRGQASASKPMSGSIGEIPLPDLLQLLSTSKKSGVLSIAAGLHVGRLYLRKGQIYYASIDESFDMPPRKAMFRMLTWSEGTFELEPPDEKQVLEEIQESTEALLMEGVRQIDEMLHLAEELPPADATLVVPRPLAPPLRELTPAELETLQLAMNHGSVQEVLDHSPTVDLETAQRILGLIRKEYLALR